MRNAIAGPRRVRPQRRRTWRQKPPLPAPHGPLAASSPLHPLSGTRLSTLLTTRRLLRIGTARGTASTLGGMLSQMPGLIQRANNGASSPKVPHPIISNGGAPAGLPELAPTAMDTQALLIHPRHRRRIHLVEAAGSIPHLRVVPKHHLRLRTRMYTKQGLSATIHGAQAGMLPRHSHPKIQQMHERGAKPSLLLELRLRDAKRRII